MGSQALGAFASFQIEPIDFHPSTPGRLFVIYRIVAEGKRSDLPTTLTGYAVFTMRRHRVLHAAAYQTKDAALEAPQG